MSTETKLKTMNQIPQSVIAEIKRRIIAGETTAEIAAAVLADYDGDRNDAIWGIQEELEAESSGPE